MKLPEVNKYYKNFDDGKIRPSRMTTVKITKIIPYNEIDSKTLSEWDKEVSECDWLYSSKTDYFIFGLIDSDDAEVVYVRMLDNRWFSLGWWAGLLDVDGSLEKEMIENMQILNTPPKKEIIE